MYQALAATNTSAARTRAAMAGYGRVSLEARIAGASPHELVLLLYKRLTELLREARDAAQNDDILARLKSAERALVIIDGLDATLDMKRGGSVAKSLRIVYELLRARVLSTDPADLDAALLSVREIADAWSAIRPA